MAHGTATDGPGLMKEPLSPSANWFNELFEYLGHSARVKSVAAKSIGTGQIGTNVRFDLTFDGPQGSAPASLVGKFPSVDSELSRETAKGMGHYVREVNFYRTFPEVAERVAPKALYTALDDETHDFILLMEDMAPAVQGDQLGGVGPGQAELAMKYAAILHAARWDDDSLNQNAWMEATEAAPPPFLTSEQVAGLWYGFKDRYGDQVAKDVADVGDAFAASLEKWGDGYTGPKSLSHGDYRLDNMLFGKSVEKPLAVVDWQTVGYRAPAQDVAYFIGAGLKAADLEANEKPLLETYLKALQAEGITSYSFEDLYTHYRWFTFYGMSVAFGAAMIVKRTERGDEMFLTMLRRHAKQAIHCDAVSLLP